MSGSQPKTRLDTLLVERGLVDSREIGRRLIMAGEVLVNDQSVIKPSTRVAGSAEIRVKARPRFVSRGGEKLAAALDAFPIDPAGRVCADVGASTGGFTDCLLQNGAAKVYAIDVGYGQLAWSLRQDDRVIVYERENARYLESLPEKVSLVTIDVSFISLEHILKPVRGWLADDGEVVALIKPQFEAGRSDVGKGGVVRDPAVHVSVIQSVLAIVESLDYIPFGLIASPIKGPKGNIEFLLWSRTSGESPVTDWPTHIDEVVDIAQNPGPAG